MGIDFRTDVTTVNFRRSQCNSKTHARLTKIHSWFQRSKKWKEIGVRKPIIELTWSKAVRTNAIQLQYNCNTRIFFLYCCSCIAHVRTPAIQRSNTSFLQLAENLQAICSSCKKLVLQLYCACAGCCNTTKFLCYFIVVFISSFHELMQSRGVRLPSVCPSVRLSVCKLCANRFFYHKHDWIATKLAHDGPRMDLHPGCAQGQGQGQRSRDTGTFVMSRNVCYTVRSHVLSLHALTLWNTIIYSPSSISIRQLDV